jgi:hypothetical protein
MEAFFQFCTQQVDKIPATFWGVVIGSLFTLAGITLTNRASDRRQRMQLENDRDLSNRGREMAFRKETYTAAAEAIALSMSVFSRFSELSYSMKEISAPYLENSHTIAKVNLVAGEETIRALIDFGMEFSGAFLRLSQQRMVLDILQKQIAEKVALVTGFEKTRDAMIELMRHHNIEGIQDDRRFQMLKDNFDFEAGRIATTYQEIQQMTAELVAKHTPFAIECFAETKRVNRPLIPLLVAARAELELPLSKNNYAELISQMYPTLEGDMGEFIQKISDARAAATISQ